MEGHAALAQVMDNLRRLASLPSRVSAGASEVIRDLIAEEFATESDPYGNPWAPHAASTVRRWGSHPILDLTGQMKQVSVRPMRGSGISITLGAEYSQFHQTGTGNMPARKILPDERGLPETWEDALDKLCEDEFDHSWEEV